MDSGPRGHLWMAAASCQQSPHRDLRGQQSQPQTRVWLLPGHFQGQMGGPCSEDRRHLSPRQTQGQPHGHTVSRAHHPTWPPASGRDQRQQPFLDASVTAGCASAHMASGNCTRPQAWACWGTSHLWWQRRLSLQAEGSQALTARWAGHCRHNESRGHPRAEAPAK